MSREITSQKQTFPYKSGLDERIGDNALMEKSLRAAKFLVTEHKSVNWTGLGLTTLPWLPSGGSESN